MLTGHKEYQSKETVFLKQKTMKRAIQLLIFLLMAGIIYSQSAKQYAKAGKEFVEAKKYNDAIAQLTKAIDLEPKKTDYYMLRSDAYEKNGDMSNAYEDVKRAIVFDNDADLKVSAGRLAYLMQNYNEALTYLDKALEIKHSNNDAYVYDIKSLIAIQDYKKALPVCEKAFLNRENSINYYLHGIVLDNLGNYEPAEKSLKKAISKDKKNEEAYIALADLQIRTNKLDDAMDNCESLLKVNSNNTNAYVERSKIYVKRQDYPSAINDISKAIIMKPEDDQLFFIRGQYYQQFTQYQNAINDYNKVLMLNNKNAEAYYQRASCYEQVANFKSAVKDYETLASLSAYDGKAMKLLDIAKKRMYELNRESNPPAVKLFDPLPHDKTVLDVAKDKKETTIKGRISDESEIESLQINGKSVPFVKNEDGYDFISSVNIDNIDMVAITATDVYKNTQDSKYTINRTEINPPAVVITTPYSSDNGEIYIDTKEPSIYVEGKVSDESLVKSVLIEGVSASYKLDDPNPVFSANVSIANKNKISVVATDIYGNQTEKEFPLNRDGANIAEDNPMGKTWVVFIENSNYQTFASLEGPVKDISLMKSALVKYKISNIIHKKDMTKKEMEKFFSIDLRDIIKNNHVNALLLWYAGHGKFINNSGYWIPVDANREDEFTYFNISALKASMQGYNITHLLVVTDACESGPTFYQAMRGTGNQHDCGDWKSTKFKSSQVFSSAGYELAVDNSQFTRTFANTLANNPDACIPIENIVKKVSAAVTNNKQQKPQFGKIAGLEDEDGTFFFMTK
jgi:tetratricopeptide (TPR) repeat protein